MSNMEDLETSLTNLISRIKIQDLDLTAKSYYYEVLRDLRLLLEDYDSWCEEKDSLKSQLEDASYANSAREEEINTLEDENASLEDENATLENEMQALTTQNEELEKQLDAIRGA